MGKRRWYKKNRGASLVAVVTTLALISILVSVILTTSLMNMQMRMVNKRSIDNFYNAEEAMDEIRVGLQQVASEAAGEAYTKVMEQYSTNNNNNARQILFASEYAGSVKNKLKGSSDSEYDITILRNYIGTSHRWDGITGTGAELTLQAGTGPDLMVDAATGAVTLKNLRMRYRSDRDYVSIVETDIILTCPEIGFIQTGDAPDLLSYATVSNGSMYVNGTVGIEGNAYAGGGLNIQSGSDCTISDWGNMIVAGGVSLMTGGTLTSGRSGSFWADEINVNESATLNLIGNSYIADDLNIIGGGTVTLEGEYYGFGNPRSAIQARSTDKTDLAVNEWSYSSCINLIPSGSGGATLDARGLRKFMVAGNAYENGFLLGESLHIAGLTGFYLAPTNCFYPPDDTGIVTNPSPVPLIAEPGIYGLDYSAQSVEDIQNPADGLHYYYLKFQFPSKALAYYKNFMGAYADAHQAEIASWVNQILPPADPSADVILNGGMLCYDGGNKSYLLPLTDAAGEIVPNSNYYYKQIDWQDQYYAYQADTLFVKLINVAELTRTAGSSTIMYEYDESGVTYHALVSNGNCNIDASTAPDVGLVIADGNVTVSSDFDGTIICSGTITLNGGSAGIRLFSNITKASILVQNATYMDAVGEHKLSDLLNDPGSHGTTPSASGGKVDFSENVSYQNWSKE